VPEETSSSEGEKKKRGFFVRIFIVRCCMVLFSGMRSEEGGYSPSGSGWWSGVV